MRNVVIILFFLLASLLSYGQSFITTWKTDNPGISNVTSITIPTTGGGYNYDVDWNNDGIFDQFGIIGDVTHNFGAAGTYTIQIQGDFPRIYFNESGDREKIIAIEQWGNISWTSMSRAFYGASNLISNAVDTPDLTGVSDLSLMLRSTSSFTGDLSNWNVSSVTDMASMFHASSFNGDLSTWDVSSVTNMVFMFSGSSFDGDLSNWDVNSVMNMGAMFNASSFNGNVSTWDVSSVTNMEFMFRVSPFNGDLSDWDVSSVINMRLMFNGSSFNGNVSDWDVSSVTNMWSMFNGSPFNGNLGNWDISSVTDMNAMLDNSGMSVDNYDNTLIGWNNQSVQNNITLGASSLEYCQGGSARQNLIDNNNWTFIGDSEQIGCVVLPVELMEFSGRLTNEKVVLNWTTASEINNLGFEIQKSNNAIDWQALDFIQGNGTSSLINKYEYQDANPLLGINYYRLKQIDYDGAFEFSKVITVNYRNLEKNIQIFPNPSNGLVNIQIDNPSNQRMIIKITDSQGRKIWESKWIEGESNWVKKMEIDGNGIYFIIARIGNEISYERVIILDEK